MELQGGTARRYRALQPPRLRGCRIANMREYARVKTIEWDIEVSWTKILWAVIACR